MMASVTRSRAAGFTLIEVLATLVFAAIILPVVLRGISLATTAASDARRRAEATALAQNRLAELIATGEWQAPGLTGDFGQEWPEYQWAAEVTNWEGTSLRQVQVRVTWWARGQEHAIALTTLVYAGGQ